jgi:hypothetical protein
LLKASFKPLIAKSYSSEMTLLSFALNFYISEAMPVSESDETSHLLRQRASLQCSTLRQLPPLPTPLPQHHSSL